MPTPEQNKETVSVFAREVFGNKNLDYANKWLSGRPRSMDPF